MKSTLGRWPFIILLTLLLNSCAQTGHIEKTLVQAYAGDALATREVASLRCYVFETIKAIDGRNKYANIKPGDCNLELLPGRHIFEIGYSHPTYKGSWLLDPKTVEFELKAGHTYMLWGSSPPIQTKPKGWDLLILDMTEGSKDRGSSVPFILK